MINLTQSYILQKSPSAFPNWHLLRLYYMTSTNNVYQIILLRKAHENQHENHSKSNPLVQS